MVAGLVDRPAGLAVRRYSRFLSLVVSFHGKYRNNQPTNNRRFVPLTTDIDAMRNGSTG